MIPYNILPSDSLSVWKPWWMQSIDSLGEIPLQSASDVSEGQTVVENVTLSILHDDIQSMADNGIGYSDAVGHVAFPLIIALFAFAFTFLFSAINDVNKRYGSKRISLLFQRSLAYRLFMWISGVSVLFIVAFAGMSLFGKPAVNDFLLSYGTIVGVILAGLYAIAVLWFAQKCIAYNKPVHLIAEITTAYEHAKKLIPVRLFSQRCKKWFVGFFHGKGYKEFRGFGYRLNKSGLVYSADSAFIEQLADLTKYSLDTNDTGLVYSVLESIDDIVKQEKNAIDNGRYRKKTAVDWSGDHRLTMQFFEKILESSNSRWDEQVEESLVWELLGSFSKSKYIRSVDIYFLFKYLQKLVSCGRISLIRKYVDRSKYSFSFLPNLADVAYVKGANAEEVELVETESYENWSELRDYHFLVAAYWIAEGEYSLLPELLHDQSYRSVYLYPIYAADILFRYQQCKKRVSDDGCYFDHTSADELFGKKLDLNAILDRYTAILLLLCHEGERISRQGVKEEDVVEISKAQKNIEKYFSSLKADPELRRLRPDIHSVDYDKVFEVGLKGLTNYYPKQKDKNPFCKKYDPFSQPLDENAKMQMDNLFASALQHRLSLLQGYWRDNEEGMEYQIVVEPFKTIFIKDVLTKPSEDTKAGFFWASRVLDVVVNRLMYLFLEYVNSASISCKTIKNHNLKDFVTEFLNGHEKEYILLDVGGRNSVLLEPRFGGNEQYFNKETLYKSMDEVKYNLLADLPLYEKYKHSVLIIQKSSLPSIKRAQLSISYKDISSKKDGNYAVELTVTPGIEVYFPNDVEIFCLKPER